MMMYCNTNKHHISTQVSKSLRCKAGVILLPSGCEWEREWSVAAPVAIGADAYDCRAERPRDCAARAAG